MVSDFTWCYSPATPASVAIMRQRAHQTKAQCKVGAWFGLLTVRHFLSERMMHELCLPWAQEEEAKFLKDGTIQATAWHQELPHRRRDGLEWVT
eukprot:546555-Pelagomonas_calceolata.AAC.4